MRVLVLADTHVRDGSDRDLPPVVWEHAGEVDAILHAGDILGRDLLGRLSERAPTYAVLGNNDVALIGRLPERRIVELDGLDVGMIHDTGQRSGRAERVRRWFPECPLVVFGHSHEPCDEVGSDGQRLFNPGSAVERRRQPHHTYGLLEIEGGSLVAHEVRIVPAG